MSNKDEELARRVRGIVAVVSPDIDAVMCEVEDGVAYIEGVVPDDQARRTISRLARQLDGLTHVVTCLATEQVVNSNTAKEPLQMPAPVLMHYQSLS